MRKTLWALAAMMGIVVLGCGPSITEQFKRAQAAGTMESYQAFIQANPEAPDELLQQASEGADKLAFEAAQKEKSADAYDKYLEDWPEGQFTKEAMEGLDDLAFAKATESGSFAAYLEERPEGKHAEAAQQGSAKSGLANAQKDGVDSIRSFAEKHPDYQEAWAALEAAILEDAGDSGCVQWKQEKDGKITGLRAISGHAGGKVFNLKTAQIKKDTVVFKKGKTKIGLKLSFDLVGEFPSESVTAVAYFRGADGGELLTSGGLKLKKKKLVKKGGGKAKASIKYQGEGMTGSATAHVFLVAGGVDGDASSLKPISNITSVPVTIQSK